MNATRFAVAASVCLLAVSASQCVPRVTAGQVSYADQDPRQGFTSGTVVIVPAADESTITVYNLYWGSSPATKLSGAPIIASIPKTGATLRFPIASGTQVPAGANSLVVFTANASGEDPLGVGTTPVDNFVHFVDVSAAAAAQSGFRPSATIDASGRMFVATIDGANSSGGLRGDVDLYHCTLPIPQCTRTGIPSPGQPQGLPAAAIDDANQKVVVATTVSPAGDLGFNRCNFDSTGCTFAELSPAGVGQGITPAVYVDRSKLRIASRVLDNLILFSCNLDGTGCSSNVPGNGFAPSIAVSALNPVAAFVGVWTEAPSPKRLGAYVCALPAFSSCFFVGGGIATPGDNDQSIPSAPVVVDDINHRLLLLGVYAAGPTLYMADEVGLEQGTTSTFTSVALPLAAGMVPPFDFLIDKSNEKLLVVGNLSGALGMLRCELDGTSCTFVDLSAGQPAGSGTFPSAVIDAGHERLLIATDDAANGDRLGMFWIDLW